MNHLRGIITATLVALSTLVHCSAATPDLPATLDPTIITDPVTGANPEERDRKVFEAFQKDLGDLPNTDPRTAVLTYTQFLTDHPNLSPMVGVDATAALGKLYHSGVKDDTQALAIYDWGLKKWSAFPGSVSLLTDRANILLAQGKIDEAETSYRDRLPQILHGWPQYANDPMNQYSKMLLDEGKTDEMITLLGRFLVLQPAFLDPGPPNWDWAYSRIIDALIKGNKPKEALRWAKMRFEMAAYDSGSIDRASRLLTRALAADNDQPGALDLFAAAEKDPIAHNPLADVKLPDLDPNDLKEEMGGKAKGADEISMFILSGDLKGAMTQARAMQENKDTAKQGILQVCRVFKAADLNLNRANAYLHYLKTGQGDDPAEAFLKQPTPAG